MARSGSPIAGKVLVAGEALRRCESYLRRLGHDVASVGSCRHVERMLELDTHHFDAAVIGVSLPDGDGIRLVRPLLERRPLCKSIVVAQSCAPEIPVRALREGAQSFLPWPCGPSALRHAVVETMAASRHWRERLGQRPETGGLPAESAGADVGSSAVSVNLAEMVARLRYLADLTPMQTIVVWRLLWGDGNERIAALLGVTKRTVKYHVNQVLQRTGARSRGDVLRVLLEDCGVVDPWDGMDEVSR